MNLSECILNAYKLLAATAVCVSESWCIPCVTEDLHHICICDNFIQVMFFSLLTFSLPIMRFHESLLTREKCLKFSVSPESGCQHLGINSVSMWRWDVKLIPFRCQVGYFGSITYSSFTALSQKEEGIFNIVFNAWCSRSCQEVRHTYSVFLSVWHFCLLLKFFEDGIQMCFSCPDEVPKAPHSA